MTMQMLMADERWAGREEGLKEGYIQGVLTAISGLTKTMSCSVEKAMEALCIPEDERAQYAALLQDGKETMP